MGLVLVGATNQEYINFTMDHMKRIEFTNLGVCYGLVYEEEKNECLIWQCFHVFIAIGNTSFLQENLLRKDKLY